MTEVMSPVSHLSHSHRAWLLSVLMHFSRRTTLLVSIFFLVAIGLMDWVTGPERSLGVFYIVPIALVTLKLRFSVGIAASVLSVMAWVIADFDWTTTQFPENLPYWNASVRLGFFAVITALLAALKGENERITELARADPLTGVLNSRSFREDATAELRRMGRSKRPLTLLYLDIDDFKKVNDEFGHDVGDDLLRRIAEALRDETRAATKVARLGGDEFAILLPDTCADEAATVVERLRRRIQEDTSETPATVTVSMGSATCAFTPMSVDELLAEADSLMYLAKGRGGDVVVYSTLTNSPMTLPG